MQLDLKNFLQFIFLTKLISSTMIVIFVPIQQTFELVGRQIICLRRVPVPRGTVVLVFGFRTPDTGLKVNPHGLGLAAVTYEN